jgi:hypothetical protein
MNSSSRREETKIAQGMTNVEADLNGFVTRARLQPGRKGIIKNTGFSP